MPLTGLKKQRKQLGIIKGYNINPNQLQIHLIAILVELLLLFSQPVITQNYENQTNKLDSKSIINDPTAEDTDLPYTDKHLLTYENSNKQANNESALCTKSCLKTNKENESTINDAPSVVGTVFSADNDNKALPRESEDAAPINRVQENLFDAHKNSKRLEQLQSSVLNSDQVVVRKLKTIVNFEKRESEEIDLEVEKRDIADAVDHGMRSLEELVNNKEPLLYNLGLFLNNNEPAAKVANFGKPSSPKAILLSQYGYASLEASKKISDNYRKNVGRLPTGIPLEVQSRVDVDECPLRGRPRCPPASLRFRTADGTCNNLQHPWRGSAMLPMQRFLPPVYEDGIQGIRRSIFGTKLPSPRAVSTFIHRDEDRETQSVTLMFMQWGQFIDHDITSTVKSRGFNGSVPQCCEDGGLRALPREFLHPSCLPIEVPRSDPFLSRFNIGCMEFIRSAPSTRLDCELGWREQINQVTSYIDASTIYGSDVDTSDSTRTFRNGQIFYGSSTGHNHHKPDGLCKLGALSEDCVQPGDNRFNENPGLVAIHTVFVRYHNKIAAILSRINPHWSDERTYQETKRIVYSVIQHVTYREYLPVVLGPEVVDLFELRLLKKGYYSNYDSRINPTVANSFSTAAFRFGHSMVQNSFVRTDSHHIPLFNNVSLHEESANLENIWSPGSLDRLLLGFASQPSQKRDEFMADELTNHLFQFSSPFGMDLAAINIQRGRDHGIPPYVFFREPCGLSPVKSWRDLQQVMSISSVSKLRRLYVHVDDLDLFTAGLAEKPLKGGVVGPTFACIIAQQFSNLRKGDRFWYENRAADSSFSPAQLQQIRKTSLSQIICQTMNEVETIQPFAFLSADNTRNARISCDNPEIRNFDLAPWTETSWELNSIKDVEDSFESERSHKGGRALVSKRRTAQSIPGQQNDQNPLERFKRGAKTDRAKLKNVTEKSLTNKKGTKLKTTTQTLTVTDKSNSAQLKYGNFNNMPSRPAFSHSTTSRPNKIQSNYYQIQDSDHNDVTYLLGLVPERPAELPPNPAVQLNINIHYIPQVTTSSPIYVPSKNKRPTITSPINYVTARPTLTNIYKPSPTYEENNVVLITKRPVTSTRRPETTKHPDDISYPVFVYKPAYDKPNKYSTHQTIKPTYFLNNMEYATTNGLKRPNSNGLEGSSNYQRPRPSLGSLDDFVATSHLPHDSRPTNTFYNENSDYNLHTQPVESVYGSSGSNYHSYRPTVFEDRPFSSSNRPTYSNLHHNFGLGQPLQHSSFDDNDESVITTGHDYNRDEATSSDDISNEFFDRYDQDVRETNRKSGTGLKPGVFIDDKLDFKSRIVDQRLNRNAQNDFIKVGVVKKLENFARVEDLPIKAPSRTLKGVRVLDVDVTPSESSGKWKFFNTTEEYASTREMPELPMNVPCSFEVPKPMAGFLPPKDHVEKV